MKTTDNVKFLNRQEELKELLNLITKLRQIFYLIRDKFICPRSLFLFCVWFLSRELAQLTKPVCREQTLSWPHHPWQTRKGHWVCMTLSIVSGFGDHLIICFIYSRIPSPLRLTYKDVKQWHRVGVGSLLNRPPHHMSHLQPAEPGLIFWNLGYDTCRASVPGQCCGITVTHRVAPVLLLCLQVLPLK